MLSLNKYLPKRGFSFITQYVHCDLSTQSTADLLKRVLFGEGADSSLFRLTRSGDRRLHQILEIVEGEGSIGAFGTKLGGKKTQEKNYGTYVSDDLVQQFRQLLGTIKRDNQDRTGVLIVIDEFDRFPDKASFASIVKTVSSSFVNFVLVGIANTVPELLQGHSSVGRQVDSITVTYMPEYELTDILQRAEYRVNQAITFEPPARQAIVRMSEGFPYFTHLLGREAMLIAFDRDLSTVGDNVVKELGQRITEGRLRTIYEEVYQNAVKSSAQREVLLKLFAESDSDAIFTADVYENAKGLEISNPSQLMKELTWANEGSEPILTKVRDRYYRFTDPVFKVYARVRSWKFDK